MNHIMKRSVSFVLALLMVLSLAPQLSLRADAAELGGLSDSSIGLDYTEADNSGVVDWSASGAQIIGSAKGAIHTTAGYYRKETSTLTITNNKASAAKLRFNYVVTTATANDSVTIDGTAYTGSGSVSVELAAKGSLVIVLTAGQANEQNNAAITITNLALIADRDATTTFQAAENGSYTVTDAEGNEVEITADTQLVQHSSKAYTLKATADEGYMFFGWYNVTTGSYISYTAETVYQSDADQTIVPVFTSTSTAMFEVGVAKFMDLGAAADYAVANSKNQIVLISSGTISGDYTIPAGITLLIPFDDAYTCYTTEPSNTTDPDKTGELFSAAVAWVEPYAYKTLTMAAGSSITVNGAISVSGQHTAGNSANGVCSYVGCPTGPLGFIDMAEGSEIVINNGGAAYVWGYIIGDGEITAKSGATVYENMQFTDFRGGSATLRLVDPEGLGGQIGVFPLSQYYVQNVEVKMTLEAGANEYVYTSLFMKNLALSSGVKFMGDGAMFVAEDGGYITKEYIPETDRLEIDVYGDAQINSLSLELGGTKVNSSDYTLPINSNITININSGKTAINQNMALLPGSRVTIADGAELSLAEGWNVYIYDATEWDSYYQLDETAEMGISPTTGGHFVNQGKKFIAVPYSPTRTYTRTVADLTDVTLDVNGTLSGNGYLYTTESGANVTNSKGTGLVSLVAGLNLEYENRGAFGWYTYQALQNGEFITPAFIPATSIKLHNADGSYTGTEDAAAGDAYGWDLAAGKWVKITDATLTFDANGGSGEMAAVTVTKDAIISGDNGITLAANAFTKTGHIFKGWALSADGEVYYADSAAIKVSTGLTLYAVWEPETYDVEFCSEDWSGTMVATYGEKFEIPGASEFDPAPSKEGYSLVGWTTVENGTEVEYVPGDLIDVTADMTLYAVWQINKYTVTWVDESGNTVATEEVEHGSDAANVPAVPGKEGHTGAWEQEAKNVTSDLTIRPVYTVNSYTITWKNADGAVLDTDEVEFGKTPVYTGETPTQAATAMYSYTFAGWTPDVAAVTGDATYTATYTETVNEYTITWIVDGVETVDTYTFGQTVEIPENPEKVGHTFAGWGAEIPAAMPAEDLTFTAQWTVNTYTITWKNADGTVLDTDEVEYGKTPVYTGNVPTKAADAQYTYFFAGWDPVVVAVTGDATYTAVYTTEVQTYTVTWVNADGTVLETDYDVPCGEMPSYDGAAPTKAADTQYTYTFAGWTPEVSMVTGDVTYTAVYTQTVNTYTVTWKNADGTVLETDENVPYGETPSYDGAAPTKEGNAQYTYTFAGWTPEVDEVTGDATYTAVYTEKVNTYTITWVDADGTVLETDENVPYGETPSYDGKTPTKAATAQHTYTFAGWTPEVDEVTGDAIYTAVYTETVNIYTITWKNADGTVLATDKVEYGKTPVYTGATPTKAATAQYTYTFADWDREILPVTGDATYNATYTATVNKYTVKFVNEDGTVLQESQVAYGEIPAYTGAEPEKEGNAQYSYTFAGWNQEVVAVTGDATYTAWYTQTVNTYTVIWADEDGTVLETDENVPYGQMPEFDGDIPVKAETNRYSYTFAGWDKAVIEVTGDVTYSAVYKATDKMTVKWVSITTTLSGDIGLNFYAQVSDAVLNDPTAFVRFVFDGKTRDIPVSEAVESTRNGTVCYRFTCLITSKNMTDSVTAQFMNAEGTIGDPKTMDVATYCNWIIANYSDQKTVGLMKAMLNYGASAQMLFGHNTDNLANAALSEEDKVLPTVDASKYAHVNEGSEDGIKVSSMTLLLDSETTVRVYFTLTGDKTIDEYTFIVDGQEVVPTEKSGRYFVEIRNIAAHRLNQWHTVTCGGITVKYAALSYVNQVMNYAAATPETVEMAKALFAYFEAAAAYLA